MPRVDELIDRLGMARYVNTLDLTKGYWQVPLAAASPVKTAFSIPGGDIPLTGHFSDSWTESCSRTVSTQRLILMT